MFKSLLLYSEYFSNALASRSKRAFIFNDLSRIRHDEYHVNETEISLEDKIRALDNAVNWLLFAQKQGADDGMGCYHLIKGWKSSYPETTGYILPSLINYAKHYDKLEILEKVNKAANWLLEIQKPSGGWQGGRIADDKEEIVFNTAQIIRGMLAVYELHGDNVYLESAIKAADWLCKIQTNEGYWKGFALMNEARVYDSYVDVPLLQLFSITSDSKYKKVAEKNLDWIINQKQQQNAWFADCDNTIKRNDKPILHTIAYTIDGLLHSGMMLNEEKYIKSAQRAAEILLEKFLEDGKLNGRYDSDWNGSECPMTTAYAQMAIIWFELCKLTNDRRFWDAAVMVNSLLVRSVSRPFNESENTKGSLSGSLPIWGRYEPFTFPNWATKYFTDSLMLEVKLSKQA